LYKKKEEIMPVLANIETIYNRVKFDKELVTGNGFCFRLLDPATNIPSTPPCPRPKLPPLPPLRRRLRTEQDDGEEGGLLQT
jgi:hypothetical protein